MGRDSSPVLILTSVTASRPRWIFSAVLGGILALAAIVLSNLAVAALFRPVEGIAYACVGLFQLALVPLAVWIGLRPVGLNLHDIGLRGPHVGRDLVLGLSIAVGFAILQFGLLIPLTGGASRSDVATNTLQIGDSAVGVLGVVALAWTGGFSEELLFRGHLLTTLRNAMGESIGSLVLAAGFTVVVFALLHGYQGWAGIVDSALYGGLALTVLFLGTKGRLAASIAAHAGWNSLAAVGLYLWY